MKILVIHGPNINMMGKRDQAKYGGSDTAPQVTMQQINDTLKANADAMGIEIDCFQSNHEGDMIDFLQKESSREADGAILNAGALIRYAYAFRQAFMDWNKPFIEVHMSDINKTGVNKKVNVLDDVPTRLDQVIGLKEKSYYVALEKMVEYIKNK